MNRKKKKSGILSGISVLLTLFDLLLIWALRPAWAGIGEVAGIPVLAYILVAVSFILFILTLFIVLQKPLPPVLYIITGIAAVIGGAYLYVLWVDIGDWPFIVREFFTGLGFAAAISIALFLIFNFSSIKILQGRAAKTAIAAVVVIGALAAVLDIVPNAIVRGPVVYAVGNDYQIVYTSRARSTAWVEIGGSFYYDTFAGYERSETRVHKISVPMKELDAAGSYTIFSRAMILRGGYWALQGRIKSREIKWRPVDETDGIQYYCISDNHGFAGPSIDAGSFFGDKLDFLVINGDTMSFLERRSDLEMPLKLGWGITKGERPVVYARGNHETKGIAADKLHRYVGADGGDFFYDFRLGSLWGVVLDFGEDHADDWYEFYGTARFDEYRSRQTAFLDALISDSASSCNAAGIETRICISHIPVNFRTEDNPFGNVHEQWLRRLDEMELDLALYGHRHALMYISTDLPAGEPLRLNAGFLGKEVGSDKIDGYRIDSSFPAFIGGRRSDAEHGMSQNDLFGRKMIGTAVDTSGDDIIVRFTDAELEKVGIIGAWTGEDFGTEIRIVRR